MAKKKVNLDEAPEETPKEPQDFDSLLKERDEIQAEEDAKAEAEAQKALEDAQNPEVEVDLDEEKEKTKLEAKEEIEKDIIAPLKEEVEKLKGLIAPEQEDEYDKYVKDYKKEHGEDVADWKIFAAFSKDNLKRELDAEKVAQEEAQKTEEAQTLKTQQDQADANFKTWQVQLEEMDKDGRIPHMLKPEKGDEGFEARVKLYGLMQETWNKEGIVPIGNLYEVFTKFGDKLKETSEVPGADAPVSFGSDSGGAEDDEKYNYSEVHNGGRDIETFAHTVLKKAGLAK